MERLNFFKYLCLLALVFTVGCQADKYDANDPLSEIYQTQWQGTFKDSNSKSTDIISLAFESDSSGICVYRDPTDNEVRSTFKYRHDNKVVSISFNNILNGNWWIQCLTRSELIMQTDPYVESSKQTLTLNRIY